MSEESWKLWLTVGIEPAISDVPTAVKPDTCIMQDTNYSADLWIQRVKGNF